MTKKLFPLFLLIVACAFSAASPQLLDERWERAYQAWDSGDYVTALRGFDALLKGPDADRWLERIALTTGELYQVKEVAPDGRSPRFSPSGRYVAFETGTAPSGITHIVDVENQFQKVADVQGESLSFSPSKQTAVYLRPKDSPEVAALRKEIDDLSKASPQDQQALTAKRRQLSMLESKSLEIVLLDLASGKEQRLEDPGLLKAAAAFSSDGSEIYLVGAKETDTASCDIYALSESGKPRALTSGTGYKTGPIVVPGGKYLVYMITNQSPFQRGGGGRQGGPGGGQGAPPAAGGGTPPARGQGVPPDRGQAAAAAGALGGRGGGGQGQRSEFAVFDLAAGTAANFSGSAPAIAANGSALVYLADNNNTIQFMRFAAPLTPAAAKKSTERIGSAALSPDGSHVTFELPYTRNTEIFCIKSDGTEEVRVSREIQPDWSPRFVSATKILAIKGERRHARSYLYDLNTLTNIKLFHNNTIRTIAPEYEWAANPAGNKILITAQRDGDTIASERGVYVLDLDRKITKDALLARIRENFAAEQALRTAGDTMFRPIADKVRSLVEQVSITKLYEYEAALFDFDSKHISQPGNKLAGDYIFRTLESFGYQPEYQWFNSREIRTANILATLHGSENPDLIYVLSSHYDSNQRGPGADDNSSATAVLLETARIMAKSPMPATIIFAAFTGEEAGLLGSREFVRQAAEKKLNFMGALNNDMIGWTNDHRLDNTIRYSNPGIRDLQHAASFLFSKMITYDARYFKSTDAAAYYDAYGDIVGGFGSYPVLGNPYYHQPTDLLETVNHQLLVEATKANTASIMLLAASPARLKDLKASSIQADAVEVSWTPSPEKSVTSYTVTCGPESNPTARTMTVKTPNAKITGAKKGEKLEVAVRAVNSRGLTGWDWARITVTPQ
jgi:Tol biopolymer transport system component